MDTATPSRTAAHVAPSHDILKYERHPLSAIFEPRSVAVIGASEKTGSVGRTILWNLISSPFGGTVYPVNPTRPSILGVKAYPNLAAIPDPVDLAVIVTPAPTVPGIMAECVEKGVKGVIVISAGFKETGSEGVELEKKVLEQARRGNIRLVGPNCLGVMRPPSGLNATFASGIAHPGSVGFISQSGALLTAVLDWSRRENVGFSAFASLGSMLDVGWGDLIYYLGDDPHTRSIVIYMETIGDARSFLSAAREVALTKPIIVIKPGRTAQGSHAAASHTGSLTGSDEVLAAAFSRVGVLRVDTIAELFYMSEVLGKQPQPKGPRLTIVTNAGGPGVLATDALVTGGGELAQLSAETLTVLDGLLPAAWSHNNPVDILGDASPQRYAEALATAAQDPNSDGLLVILTPQAMTDPVATAEQLRPYAQIAGKPVLASWMGGEEIEPGEEVLRGANIPNFPYPDTAARMFNYMWRYNYNLRALYETPVLPGDAGSSMNRERARQILEAVRQEGRTLLTEVESKQLLAAYEIPVVETRVAGSEDEAVACAAAMGYPVVLKVYSTTITHKTDVGGVQLNLANEEEVRTAYRAIEESVRERAGAAHIQGVTVQPMIQWTGYEIIIGSSIDPQFGPVLLFGMGGQLVEVFKDRALALPPLNSTLALRMMERTRIYTALQGVRGRRPVDIAGLQHLLVRFSQLVVEQRLIKEIDINPLLASPDRLIALDARVVLYEPGVSAADVPPLAIRPYPLQYVQPWTAKDGTPLVIRPIRPEDEPLIVKFHEKLSEQTVYRRYFQHLRLSDRIRHERLTRICFNDYDREIALVAEHEDPATGERALVGVGRLSKSRTANDAEFAVLVADAYQRRGIGTELLRRLVQIGRDEKLSRITGEILIENSGMVRTSRNVGFQIRSHAGDMGGGTVEAYIDLGDEGRRAQGA
ncbi:MAG TPA: bifunctional acetate--CoA ligase family protein/GNAT family N-acetyltransferase [Chloroflexia bacterium]|nr:bifunctional acetate--CoA ligase family protein/GNAT family N-acetyltransferase [Chloroflexia bacterium]